ncbi:CPBP family glutamic-type intramembrane protease [Belliella aquatica]
MFKDKTLWIVFLNMIILAPILEELTCRLHTGLKLYQILISLIGAVVLFHDSWIILSLFVCYFFLLFFMVSIGVRVNRRFIIYFSALIFGVLHIDFYDFNWLANFGNTFFVVITRIFSGLLFTYVFYQKGILFSILFHMIWNMMPFISFLLKYFEI